MDRQKLEERDPWLVGANVDARDFEQPLSNEEFKTQVEADPFRSGQRGDPLRDLVEQANSREAFMHDVTLEDLQEAVGKIHDPAVRKEQAQKLKDYVEDQAADAFVAKHPEYLAIEENYAAMTEYLEENILPMTLENLETAYTDLSAAGALEVAKGQVKQLSDGDLLKVSRSAQQGRIAEAIGLYLHFALPSLNPKELAEIVNDPAHLSLTNEAVYFVFLQGTPDFDDSNEFRSFLDGFAGDRPLNFELVRVAWQKFKEAQSAQTEAAPASPEFDVDGMSDEAVDAAFQAVGREHARQIQGRK